MFKFAHVWACIYLHKFVPMLSLVYNLPAIFQSLHVSICFTLMFHSFAFPTSQYASTGSAESSTNTLLVAYPVHNLLIAWPASTHRRFHSVFHTLLHFCQFFNVWVCTCLSLYISSQFFSYVFIRLQSFHPSVPPHDSAERSTNTVLVAWPVLNFLITSPVSPHKAQQSYLPHSAIYSILPSTLYSSITPGTSFSLTSSTTLQFRLTLR